VNTTKKIFRREMEEDGPGNNGKLKAKRRSKRRIKIQRKRRDL